MRTHRIRQLILVLALGTGTVLAGPAPASAALGDLVCPGTGQLNFVPPLTGAGTGTIDVTGASSACYSPNGNYSHLLSATVTGTATVTATGTLPCNLSLRARGILTYHWSPPGVPDSLYDYTLETDILSGNFVVEGHIISGPMAGNRVQPITLAMQPNPDCLIAGLKSLTAWGFETSFS